MTDQDQKQPGDTLWGQVQREATDKESLSVQTRNTIEASGHTASDHFHGVRKWSSWATARRVKLIMPEDSLRFV